MEAKGEETERVRESYREARAQLEGGTGNARDKQAKDCDSLLPGLSSEARR